MSRYKRIPVSLAMEIADRFDKNQVIIVTWDALHGLQGVASYGKTKAECDQAARGAQIVQEALGWPPEDIVKLKPSKKELMEAIQEAYEQLLEHNRDYHHQTPQALLDKFQRFIEKEKS